MREIKRTVKPAAISAPWLIVSLALGLIIREIPSSSECVGPSMNGGHNTVALPRFLSDYLASLSVPAPLFSGDDESPSPREIRWARAYTVNERVLSMSRAAIHSQALKRLVLLSRLGAVICLVPGIASHALLGALARAEGINAERLPRLSEYAPRDRKSRASSS